MSALRNAAFMAASTGVRLVLGLVTFAVLARGLGSAEFGRWMTAFAAAALVAIPMNFGMSTQALREIGACKNLPESMRVLTELLVARQLLSAVVVTIALCSAAWLPSDWRWLFACMLFAQVLDAQTDLLNVGFRATGRYHEETRIASVSAIAQFVLVAGAMWFAPSVLNAALAFCFARLGVLILTWGRQKRDMAGLVRPSWSDACRRIRQARAYAFDYGLQSLFGQIDSLVLAATTGTAVVGVYQAGMRIFLGMTQAASVLGNVVIPNISRQVAHGHDLTQSFTKVQWVFLAVAGIGATCIALVPQQWIVKVYGPDYADLAGLLPLFALLFFARMTASMSGVMLTSTGAQGRRATFTALHWLVCTLVAAPLIGGHGAMGWLIALCAANAFLSLSYLVVLAQSSKLRLRPMPLLALGACSLAFLAMAVMHTTL